MAKKSRTHLGRREKDQSGCMWNLINAFDFRQARSSQKLLMDKKRQSKRIDGVAYANIKLESLNDTRQISIENNDTVQSEASTTENSKMSVKELMEEEMYGEKKDGSLLSGDAKSGVQDGGPVKKSRRWTRSKMSFDLGADSFVVAEQLVAEKPDHRRHKSCSTLDLSEMVEKLCFRIPQKDANNSKHDEDGETATEPLGDSSVIEKQLAEAAQVLAKHFTDGKGGTKDRKVQHSKELTEALQILNSSKELFLKLLQDPDSQLVKHIQSLQDIQVEEGECKVLTGSDLLEQYIGNAKQPRFSWGMLTGQDRNSSRKSDSSGDLSRIVVRKPGPPSLRNSDVASRCDSLAESPPSTGAKDPFEKGSFPPFFTELMRKLKHAMKKDPCELSLQSSDKQPNISNRESKIGGENVPLSSPSRDHFFIETIPKSSVGISGENVPLKLKDGGIQLEHESSLSVEQRVSNIYTEAKKHLTVIVGSNDVGVDTRGRKVPNPLGRILSYSGYHSPTLCSPRAEGDIRLCPSTECKGGENRASDDLQENNVDHMDPVIASDIAIHKDEFSTIESHLSDGDSCKTDFDKSADEVEVPLSEDIMKLADAEVEEVVNFMEISAETCSLNFKKTDNDDSAVSFEENLCSTSLGQTSPEESKESSCADSSALNCSVNEENEDPDAMSDATSRPSPISVLEPIFGEDEISPPGVKYFIANEPVRPRQINFEEEFLAPSGRVPIDSTCVDDDKYTFEFVKAVVEMSGLTWDELLRRFLFSENIIESSLIDEVDFLPDLLSCDFNLLFDVINEDVIEICRLNWGCMLSLATPFALPELKGKDIFTEVWKGVNWHLKLKGSPPTLDQIVAKDFAKAGTWAGLHLDCERIGIQMQEGILNELLEDAIWSCVDARLESANLELPPSEEKIRITEL